MDHPCDDTVTLVRAAQRGSGSATEKLFQRVYPRVRQIGAVRLGRHLAELAGEEDVVQDSILDAFRSLNGLRCESEGAWLHWLAGIVENNIRDAWRRLQVARRGGGRERPFAAHPSSLLASSVLGGHTATPSEEVRAIELAERIEDALLELDPRSRQVIEMRRLCGMAYEEIAAEMGFGAASSARSLFTRAMAQVAARL